VNPGLLAFTALPFVLSPGASFGITVNSAVGGDRRAPLRVWIGTSLGIALIAVSLGISGLGVSVIGYPVVLLVFRLLGGAVLLSLGTVSLVKAIRAWNRPLPEPRPATRLVLWSFLAVVTNVKALSLYVLVVPTTAGTGPTGLPLYALFAAIHIAMMFVWLTLVGLIVRTLPLLQTSPRARGILIAATSAILIYLGIDLVISSFR
jgi:threonine/homoserine/homoserine lactone efflux protein